MSEGTLQPSTDAVASCSFDVEYTTSINTGAYRSSIKLSDFPRISTLKTLFASVMVNNIVAEVRQETMEGTEDGNLVARGHVFIAIIPTNKDTDSASGSTKTIVNNVPNKQTFPLCCNEQSNKVFHFNLSGYEVDLAQDPRRGAGPVAWIGNSGVGHVGKTASAVVSVTWRLKVTCSGATPLWQ